MRALDYLFGQPIFSGTHFVQRSGVPAPTARRILKQCSEKGLLKVVRKGKGQQPTVYLFPELMKITEK
jgi:ribosomal protein S25